MKQQQAGHILLPTAQSHLDKRLPKSTSYVYRNEISRTLFNLQLRAMRKPSDDKSLIIVLLVSDHRQEESLEKRTKEKSGKWKSNLATPTIVIYELLLNCVGWGLVGAVKFLVLHHMALCQSFTSFFILPCFKNFFGDEATTPRICTESDFKLSNYTDCLKH